LYEGDVDYGGQLRRCLLLETVHDDDSAGAGGGLDGGVLNSIDVQIVHVDLLFAEMAVNVAMP
jgi:hypothetical protein